MSIFRSAFERILGLRVWVLVTGLLVLGGVTAVVAQTSTGGSGSGVVSTLAGSGVQGFADGPTSTAKFSGLFGLAFDGLGNMYVGDTYNHRIRKINSLGVVSTFAGSGVQGFKDGAATTAEFAFPYGVAVDGSGNVYVADYHNHRIRKINSLGVVSTFAGSGVQGFKDGAAATAQFYNPVGVAVDGSGNVYVGDSRNQRIRKIDSAGVVSTLAGSGVQGFVDGSAATAQFSEPLGVAVDGLGNVYVAEYANRVRKIDRLGVVSTIGLFYNPWAVAVDGSGNVFVANTGSSRIGKIDLGGVVSTLAGSGVPGFVDGSAATAQFRYPQGVAVDGSGNVFVADSGNHRIRKIETTTAEPTTTTAEPTTTTAQPPTTTAQPTTTTVLPFVTFRSSIVRGPNNAAGAAVYAVTLRMTGATSGAGYEIVVSSGHVPDPVPPDPTTHRYGKTAVNGEVVWEYSLVAPRGVFRADLYPAGSPSPIASVEVK